MSNQSEKLPYYLQYKVGEDFPVATFEYDKNEMKDEATVAEFRDRARDTLYRDDWVTDWGGDTHDGELSFGVIPKVLSSIYIVETALNKNDIEKARAKALKNYMCRREYRNHPVHGNGVVY